MAPTKVPPSGESRNSPIRFVCASDFADFSGKVNTQCNEQNQNKSKKKFW